MSDLGNTLTLSKEQVVQLSADLEVMLRDNDAALNLALRDPAFNAFVRFIEQAKHKAEPLPAIGLLHFVFSICDTHHTQFGWQKQLNEEFRSKIKFLEKRVEELEAGHE